MAKSSNTALKVIGLVLLIGGIGLAFWGYQMSQSMVSKFSRVLTGALPDEVMYRYIGGAICSVVGCRGK